MLLTVRKIRLNFLYGEGEFFLHPNNDLNLGLQLYIKAQFYLCHSDESLDLVSLFKPRFPALHADSLPFVPPRLIMGQVRTFFALSFIRLAQVVVCRAGDPDVNPDLQKKFALKISNLLSIVSLLTYDKQLLQYFFVKCHFYDCAVL